jgi:hypothetical protein
MLEKAMACRGLRAQAHAESVEIAYFFLKRTLSIIYGTWPIKRDTPLAPIRGRRHASHATLQGPLGYRDIRGQYCPWHAIGHETDQVFHQSIFLTPIVAAGEAVAVGRRNFWAAPTVHQVATMIHLPGVTESLIRPSARPTGATSQASQNVII